MKYYLKKLTFLSALFAFISIQGEEIHEKLGEIGSEEENNINQSLMLKPVVQFSCARYLTPQEDAWEAALKGKNDDKKLNALKNLIRSSAPSSVPLQYKAYKELKEKYPDDYAVRSASAAFDKKRIKKVIAKEPFGEKYGEGDNDYYWCMRAVGVLQMEDCIPRLLELSNVENLYTYLAAERSIEDFKGKIAEDALMEVISLWKYNAYVKASDEMEKRNIKRFSKELEKMNPPDDCRYKYAIFLAECNNPKAVPILCETVGHISMIDYRMFLFIAELGRPEDRDIILDLPNKVRNDQQSSAKRCIKKYLERMKNIPNKKNPQNSLQSP